MQNIDDGWGSLVDTKTYLEAYDQLELALCEKLDREIPKADTEIFRPKFKNHHKPEPKKTTPDEDYRNIIYNFDPNLSSSDEDEEDHDHERRKTYFRPSLQMQRNSFVRQNLMNFRRKTEMEIARIGVMGCGEMSLERGLSDYLGPIGAVQVYSVDIDEESLSVGQQLLEKHLQTNSDFISRESGLPVLMRSFVGNILEADHRFADMDAIISMEVVEHIPLADAKKFVKNVLGTLVPRLFIFSTPNHEYNQVFGMKPGEFRHDDHKFEMNRKEFADWLAELAMTFPHYRIEPPQYIGMTPGYQHLSGASQAAVCYLREDVNSQLDPMNLPYELVGHVPCRLGTRLVTYNLVKEAFLEWLDKVELRESEMKTDSFAPYWCFDVKRILHHIHASILFASTIDELTACKYIQGMTDSTVIINTLHGFNGICLRKLHSKETIMGIVRQHVI